MKKITFCILFLLSFSLIAIAQIDGNFNCSQPLPAPPECNYFVNHKFKLSNPAITHEAFQQNNVEGWYDSHGSTDINEWGIYGQIDPDINYASMAIGYEPSEGILAEGIVTKIHKLRAGQAYLLSFFLASNTPSGVDAARQVSFNITLLNCSNYSPGVLGQLPIVDEHQVVFCEYFDIVEDSEWKQVVVSFVPDRDYEMVRVYPSVSQDYDLPTLSWFNFSNPELIDISNFNAGVYNCNYTLQTQNCSVRNAHYTLAHFATGTIVYYGSVQPSVSVPNGYEPGLYTLSMTFPGAVQTHNSCSDNNPQVYASINLPDPCNCGDIDIISATFDYELDSQPPIAVTNCVINRMCEFPINGDDRFYFTGSSSIANGNIWQVRKYNGALYNNQSEMNVNGINISYPNTEDFTTYSTSANGNFTLFTGAGNDCNIEIRLINTISNASRIIKIKIVAIVTPHQNFFLCIPSGSAVCPIPHKLIYAENAPGFSYLWTIPVGMDACSPLTNLWMTWSDANFNYNDPNHPPLIASVSISNVFGCPVVASSINIDPAVCSSLGRSLKSKDAVVPGNRTGIPQKDGIELVVFPNPAKSSIEISSVNSFNEAILYSANGAIIGRYSDQKQKNNRIDISRLKAGTYFIKVVFNNGAYVVKTFFKQ